LDEQLAPHKDQWTFLSSIRKLSRGEVEEIVRHAEAKGHVVGVRFAPDEEDADSPWTMPPSRRRAKASIIGSLPENLELVLGNEIFIAKDVLSPPLRNRLIRL